MPKLSKSALFATLPPEPGVSPEPSAARIVVLDDDPTGTQTVHGIAVLTEWSVASLEAELRAAAPCFYILTNSRALPVGKACEINRQIGQNLAIAGRRAGCAFAVVSRGDSTLRGHYPQETDALAAALGGDFDGTLIIPAFLAGGRFTINDVHYVADGETLVPAGETEFARDRAFGYQASNLREWVVEKNAGRVAIETVASISIDDLRRGGSNAVAARLLALPRGGIAIVNAAARGDLAVLTQALAATGRAGKRYLFRTAADFVAAFARVAPRPMLDAGELRSAGTNFGGLLVAGSYVGKTSDQLEALFIGFPGIRRVEVDVGRLMTGELRAEDFVHLAGTIDDSLARGVSVALCTSRLLVAGRTSQENLAIGERVSSSLVQIVQALATRPAWLVAKGGITSSDVATRALGVRRALILGQALPGVPVWRTGAESRWPGLALVVFPGNVGDRGSLLQLVLGLAGPGMP